MKATVPDNLREGTHARLSQDPALNLHYRDMLAHYGAVALLCGVGDLDRKGRVESAIGDTQAALKACAPMDTDPASPAPSC